MKEWWLQALQGLIEESGGCKSEWSLSLKKRKIPVHNRFQLELFFQAFLQNDFYFSMHFQSDLHNRIQNFVWLLVMNHAQLF